MNSIRLLFWNVNNRDLTEYVYALARSTKADIVVLNENLVSSSRTLLALREKVCADFFIPPCTSEDRFHCFCTRQDLDLSEIHNGSRTSVRRWRVGTDKALLAFVHGIDIRNYDKEARQSYAQSIADEMRFVSEQQNTRKMVMLGDFNMNPYDSGMNLPTGLNAMMTRACTVAGYREYIGKKYDFYYNPMWSNFGDNSDGPAGTIYDTSNQGPYGWSIVDQVVIHHSLVPIFENVRILTEAESLSLMNKKGRPDGNRISDHFPIIVNFRSEI